MQYFYIEYERKILQSPLLAVPMALKLPFIIMTSIITVSFFWSFIKFSFFNIFCYIIDKIIISNDQSYDVVPCSYTDEYRV